MNEKSLRPNRLRRRLTAGAATVAAVGALILGAPAAANAAQTCYPSSQGPYCVNGYNSRPASQWVGVLNNNSYDVLYYAHTFSGTYGFCVPAGQISWRDSGDQMVTMSVNVIIGQYETPEPC